MKIESLLEDLDSDDAARVEAAAARLAEQADSVVPTLLQGLADRRPTDELKPFIRVLRYIGPPAFDALLAAWRRKEVADWQVGHFLEVFDERSADQYAALAADPDFRKSGNGFEGLVRLRTDSEAGLRALVACFARSGFIPHKASDYARLLHDSYRPRLRSLRRDPAESPRIRRGAMAALVAGGGADALDDRDRAAVERLIRVKILDEIPSLPSSTLSGWWMAVPGASYEGVFEALGLHDRRPVTVAAGVRASEGREIQVPGPEGGSRSVGRVFVTPELDGWRLVFGSFDLLVAGDPWDGMIETVERVSVHCGQAQLFFLDDAGGSDVWMVAENGRMIRRYAAEGYPEWEGDPLPWEILAADDPDYDEAPSNAGTMGARSACGYLSVDPDAVGPDTEVRGHGWLALTEPGVGHGAFPGTLRI
ncbi:hypothetical protein EJ357_01890 [Streptomyces cyaneochromogenes]|uniref:Uncharacterized protein n=1 Tax=Streptomyces cyaneochromogenes TaxID=2496836 RepID=A0A3S9LZI6_9ACTN|nr:hypothetical protein [Streptomyces cyaneochromogenes]AZQ32354.1 hypothetical protein EJ357_01890 [Streptomyces cyaneochromogenes]